MTESREPRHIAVIMDGNGRWARRRFAPRTEGHRAGVRAARTTIEACAERGIEALTLFAFSSENWNRPASEVGVLMDLFLRALRAEVGRLNENGVRLRFIGDRSAFDEALQEEMLQAETATRDNHALSLNIAVGYGGRWDITQAARALARDVEAGRLRADEITPGKFAGRLCLSDLPEPDLFIRTGGERRISNYLLWQLAYTELWFTEVLWPDFDAAALDEAIDFYRGRQRRFGKTGEQLEQADHA